MVLFLTKPSYYSPCRTQEWVLKNAKVTIIQGNNSNTLIQRDYPAPVPNADLEIDLSSLKLKEGGIQVEIAATDASIYHFGKGNITVQTFNMTYDSRPPIISILSKAHNFNKGGSGLVTFTANEEIQNAGVQFGSPLFSGLPAAFRKLCLPVPLPLLHYQ